MDSIRIGYFHGGRTLNIYRATQFKYFEKDNIDVTLYTKLLGENPFFAIPKDHSKIVGLKTYGKATGDELLNLMFQGKADMATIGETSFIKAVAKGLPIVAIAELGFDSKENPGHLIGVAKDVKIEKPKDLEKLYWASRRSSGGDTVIMYEYMEKMGLDRSKMKIRKNVPEVTLKKGFKKKKVQASYFHLMFFQKMHEKDLVKLHEVLNWVNPEISQSILVVTKDYYEKNKPLLKRFLRALSKRNTYENSLSVEERIKRVDADYTKGMQIDKRYLGKLGLPIFRNVPTIRIELLQEMERLLIKHKVITKKTNFEPFIKNELLESL